MRRLSFFIGLSLALVFVVPAFASVGGDIPDNGQHYNLNIIGVPKGKTVDMTDSQRHTIFVPLNTQGLVDKSVKIYYVPGPDFQVLDGNATDGEATIQVPYEYCTDYTTGCENLLSYNVYAVGLGKPKGYAVVEAHCTYDTAVVDKNGTSGLTCEDTLLMGSFTINRDKGQPKPKDITNVFRATGCLDLNGSLVCDAGDLTFTNIWIFNIEQLLEYFWAYSNTNLKLMQVRFYPTTSGSIGYVK
jgi:hypothetical protein